MFLFARRATAIRREQLEYILIGIIKTGLFTVLFIPLVTMPFALFPFVFGKAILFRILMEIILMLYVLLILINPRYRPASSLVLTTVLLWLFILVFTTFVTSVDRWSSFWGNIERSEGLILYLHLGAFFLVLVGMLRERADWFAYLRVSVLVSLVVSLIGLLHRAGIATPGFEATPMGLLTGTLGNPAFFASYLLFHVFFAVLFFNEIDPSDIRRRLLYAIVIILNVLAIILTAARTSVLGLGAGLGVFILLVLIKKQDIRLRTLCGAMVLAVCFLYLVLLWQKDSPIFQVPLFQKISDVGTIGHSFRERSIAWSVALKAFSERPFFGWGLENYELAFYRYFDPRFPYFEGFVMHDSPGFDRAHSGPLEIAATTGIFGFVGFYSIFVAACYYLWRLFRKGRGGSYLMAALISILAAYLVQNLFIFDTITSLIPLFITFGFVHSLSSRKQKRKLLEKRFFPNFRTPVSLAVFLLISIPFLFFLIYVFNVRPLLASIHSRHAVLSIGGGDIASGILFAEKASSYRTYVTEHSSIFLARMILAPVFPEEYFEEFSHLLTREIGWAMERHPRNARYPQALAKLSIARSSRDPAALEEAEGFLKKALRISPTKQEVYYDLAIVEILRGDYIRAAEYLETSIALDPKFPKSHWFLGITYVFSGDDKQARKAIREALAVSEAFRDDATSPLIWLSVTLKRFDDTRQLFVAKEFVRLFPEDWRFRMFLAVVHELEGDIEGALREILNVAEKNPDIRDGVLGFITELFIDGNRLNMIRAAGEEGSGEKQISRMYQEAIMEALEKSTIETNLKDRTKKFIGSFE